MPRLIAALVRHGDYAQRRGAPSAHQPYPLNAEGERQAAAAAQALMAKANEEGWRICPVIDSSRILRGWQTARGIADGLQGRLASPVAIEQADALAERCVGSVANLAVDEIEALMAIDPRFDPPPSDWKSNSHFRLPFQGAESLMASGERVARYLTMRMDALAGAIETDTLKIFVGHGAAFRHAAHVLGVLTFERIAAVSMWHARPLYLERLPGGAWRHLAGEWKVRRQSRVGLD